jgi:multidrug transporter EmrE-like cation transporter
MATVVLLLCMISCTVAANLLLKLGASDEKSALLFDLLSLRTGIGLATFALAAFFYAFLLKILPLNLAQSYAAAQFIAVICGAAFFLGEPISPARWASIGLIALGIVLVALTDQP